MKRILLSLFLCCSTVYAAQGFYVGGELGGHLTVASQQGQIFGQEVLATGAVAIGTTSMPKDLFDRGVAGMLFAGYGACWHSCYVAVESILQFSSPTLQSTQQARQTFINLTGTTKTHIKCCQFGLDFLPGWYLQPATLLYARVGVSAARVRLKSESSIVAPFGLVTFNLPLTLSRKEYLPALRLGTGLEQRLTQRLSLRADYVFTRFKKISKSGATSGTFSNGGNTATAFVNPTTAVRLHDHAAMLGLSYCFSSCEPLCFNSIDCGSGYQGFYLGGTLGGGLLHGRQRGSVFGVATETDTFFLAPSQVYTHQFQGMGFLGYGRNWCRLYLAGELFAAAATPTKRNFEVQTFQMISTLANTTSVKGSVKTSSWQFGFDFRPGVFLIPTSLVYGRIGVSTAEMRVSSQAFITEIVAGSPFFLSDKISKKRRRANLRLGLGVEHQLCPRVHLRADYIYTDYGRLSFNRSITGAVVGTSLDNMLSTHLRDHALLLGLSYYFCSR